MIRGPVYQFSKLENRRIWHPAVLGLARAVRGFRPYSLRSSYIYSPVRHLSTQGQAIDLEKSIQEPKSKIVLRPYQQECLDAILEDIKHTARVAVSLPTGSGKTIVFSSLISLVKSTDSRRTKTLIIVNRREILYQTAKTVTSMYPHLKVVTEIGSKRYSDDRNADVCVASIYSIHRQDRLEQFNPEEFKLIITDEAHHSASAIYQKVADYFGVADPESVVKSVGFSATMYRHDKVALDTFFEKVTYHRDAQHMIDDGHLTNAKITKVYAFAEQPVECMRRDDNNVLQQPEGLELLVKLWKEYDGEFKSTVIFAINRLHILRICKAFREAGIDARYVTGDMKTQERDQILLNFRAQKFPVIINCGVLTEGTDIPSIDQVIIARPARSSGLLMQMIGRGLRLLPGKTMCNIVVFPEMQKLPDVFALLPELAGNYVDKDLNPVLEPEPEVIDYGDEMERILIAEGDDLASGKLEMMELDDLEQKIALGDITLDSSLGLAGLGVGQKHNKASYLNWVHAANKFFLQSPPPHSTFIGIERCKDDLQWNVNLITKVDFHWRRKRVYDSSKLADAVLHAEYFAGGIWGYNRLKVISRTSSWRQLQPTKAQTEFLKKQTLSDEVVSSIDRGAAANLITLKKLGYKVNDKLAMNANINLSQNRGKLMKR